MDFMNFLENDISKEYKKLDKRNPSLSDRVNLAEYEEGDFTLKITNHALFRQKCRAKLDERSMKTVFNMVVNKWDFNNPR